MDPLTAVGAVASVVQLAQTALSLSKTLYSLGAAVASASEDIRVLAQDLRTFSQSLTILSRLLEDSKSWYSDDVYLLTARIIKDCAELYVKIDKILVKLGSNGKSTWKLRVKFVYKEGQIKKLMKQLRDMKGTLATILMSLQVDLQLSLLNISSSSKIQRPPEIPLQPETIETLREAQEAVKAVDLLPKYSERLESQVNLQATMEASPSSHQARKIVSGMHEAIRPSLQSASLQNIQSDGHTSSQVFGINQSFVMLASTAQMACAQVAEQHASFSTSRDVHIGMGSKSIKSSSSTESFKSANSRQQMDLDVARQVKAVRAVMHAFHTALQIFDNLVERRMPTRDGQVYDAAKDLRNSLHGRSREIDDSHIAKFQRYGLIYIEKFNANNSTKLQETGSTIMREIVMKLHEFSAEHEDLSISGFDGLREFSEKASREILTCLNQLVPSQEELRERLSHVETPKEFDVGPMPSLGSEPQFQDRKPKIGEQVKMPVKRRSSSSDTETGPRMRCCMAPSSIARDHAPELSLPFVGYTFKRLDNNIGTVAGTPSLPNSALQIPIRPNVLPSSPPFQPSTTTRCTVSEGHQQYDVTQLLEHQAIRRTSLERQAGDARRSQELHARESLTSSELDSRNHCKPQEQLSTSNHDVSRTAREQTASDRDLICVPDFMDDVLLEFDFDSFLHQDDDSSKFELSADERGSTFTAPLKPYTSVHLCSWGRLQESSEACDACIAHGARCDAATPTCINCRVNNLECRYDGRARAEKQDGFSGVEEEPEPPTFINAKQFYRILKRRAARQALEAETSTGNNHRASDRFKRRTTGDEATIPASEVSRPDTVPASASRGHIQGDGANPARGVMTVHASSASYHIPVDVHAACGLPDKKRVRSPHASARFRERRKANERVMIEQAIKKRDRELKQGEPPEHIHAASHLPDEKDVRRAQASARFRARRKAKQMEMIEQAVKDRDKEAEESLEEPPEESMPPHPSLHGFRPKSPGESYDPYAAIFMGHSIILPSKSPSYDPPPLQTISSRSDKPLLLSPLQESKLWWRSLAFTRLSNFAAFEVLRSGFATELSIFFDFAIDDEVLCKRVSSDIKLFEERNLRRESQADSFNEILEMRMNILRIVSTVDEQLGLQIAIFGWSCVCTVLHVYDHILGTTPTDPVLIGTITSAFTQLQEIVAMVARYAVMENLYHQSGSALSLKPEYRSSLLYLCSTILEYFSESLSLGRAIRGIESMGERRERMLDSCEQLMLTIREKDQVCQRFQVVVEARDETKSESEAEIEDVSDDSWEEILAPSSEDGLIDLDAALV